MRTRLAPGSQQQCDAGLNQCLLESTRNFLLVQIEWTEPVDVNLHVKDRKKNSPGAREEDLTLERVLLRAERGDVDEVRPFCERLGEGGGPGAALALEALAKGLLRDSQQTHGLLISGIEMPRPAELYQGFVQQAFL